MERKMSFAVKISPTIRQRVKEFCEKYGIRQGFFVEKALEKKLEEEEIIQDALEFNRLREQESEAITFEEYLKTRNV